MIARTDIPTEKLRQRVALRLVQELAVAERVRADPIMSARRSHAATLVRGRRRSGQWTNATG